MVKTYKKKNAAYGSKKAKFYKSVANYHSAKLSFATGIQYVGNTATFAINSSTNFIIGDGLGNCDDWNKYRQLFMSYKLRGILIEVVPHPAPVSPSFVGDAVVIGTLTSDDTVSFKSVVEGNYSSILSFALPTRKYMPVKGGSTGWLSTNNLTDQPGKIAVAANGSVQQGNAFYWTARFTFYVLFIQ